MKRASTSGQWIPDAEKAGWETSMVNGVRFSRPGAPVVVSESPGPGIPLAMVCAPAEFSVVPKERRFTQPCTNGTNHHALGKKMPFSDPKGYRRQCKRCGINRYVHGDGEVSWMRYKDGGATFMQRFSLKMESWAP